MDEQRAAHEPSPASLVELVTSPPHVSLREYVRTYQGYHHPDTRFRQVTLPAGMAVLILSFGDSIRMLDPDGGQETARHNTFIAGLQDRHGLIESVGLSYGIQVNLTPIGARLLTGLPMHLLTNSILELEDVIGAAAETLIERLAEAHTWEARFRMLDVFMARRIACGQRPAGVLWAYRALERGSVASIAEQLGCSQKQLIARFREDVGLPPKMMARVLRFDRAVQCLRAGPPDLAQIAIDCGYYDQAHFNREFREFAGMTPGQFLARRDPVYESIRNGLD